MKIQITKITGEIIEFDDISYYITGDYLIVVKKTTAPVENKHFVKNKHNIFKLDAIRYFNLVTETKKYPEYAIETTTTTA